MIIETMPLFITTINIIRLIIMILLRLLLRLLLRRRRRRQRSFTVNNNISSCKYVFKLYLCSVTRFANYGCWSHFNPLTYLRNACVITLVHAASRQRTRTRASLRSAGRTFDSRHHFIHRHVLPPSPTKNKVIFAPL